MEEQTKAEEKKLTAKNISKAFKFIAPAGAIICVILLWVGIFKNATIGEICALWATVYGLGAGTIDANIIIDKYTGSKNWNTSAKYADPSIMADTKKSV